MLVLFRRFHPLTRCCFHVARPAGAQFRILQRLDRVSDFPFRGSFRAISIINRPARIGSMGRGRWLIVRILLDAAANHQAFDDVSGPIPCWVSPFLRGLQEAPHTDMDGHGWGMDGRLNEGLLDAVVVVVYGLCVCIALRCCCYVRFLSEHQKLSRVLISRPSPSFSSLSSPPSPSISSTLPCRSHPSKDFNRPSHPQS